MNTSCPQCKTVFRVDPRKVPADGVRARCSVCGGVFEVVSDRGRPAVPATALASAGPSPPPPPPPPMRPAPAVGGGAPAQATPRADAGGAPGDPRPAPAAGGPARAQQPRGPVEPKPRGQERRAREAPGSAPAPAARGEPPVASEQGAPARAPRPPFGQLDPDARARRLARALISDVAAYHPERQERGLRDGRLKELFQDELKKSWQEYVEQVGLEMARSTPYFRDALNEILAKGKRVF